MTYLKLTFSGRILGLALIVGLLAACSSTSAPNTELAAQTTTNAQGFPIYTYEVSDAGSLSSLNGIDFVIETQRLRLESSRAKQVSPQFDVGGRSFSDNIGGGSVLTASTMFAFYFTPGTEFSSVFRSYESDELALFSDGSIVLFDFEERVEVNGETTEFDSSDITLTPKDVPDGNILQRFPGPVKFIFEAD